MWVDQAAVQKSLHGGKGLASKVTVLRSRIPPIFAIQGDLTAKDSQHHDPRRLDGQGPSLGYGFSEGLERDITATGTADGGVTQLRCVRLGHAIEGVGQFVARVCADFNSALGAVVIKDLLSAEAEDQFRV
jgi:hypothetical protein